MDLSQSKLSRSEWETIEIPVSQKEKKILQMIKTGYSDVNIHTNENQSMFSFVKIEINPATEMILYKNYFEEIINQIIKKYGKGTPIDTFSISGGKAATTTKGLGLKQADIIRIQNLNTNIMENKSLIFEFLLLDLSKELIKYISKSKTKYAFYLYTLLQIKKSSITNINSHVLSFINTIIDFANEKTNTSEIITNAYEFIEKNPYLLKFEDQVLFTHQKQLFTICRSNKETPKLIMYTAPTGTGKTVSPIGLSEGYRIIFVCVARHIGLALAKSAISIEKKVAFAFGCETASDIRLHYYSAIDFTKNRRSGGIGKVNNSVGDNVEIMICDVQSYLTAMHYMLAFNEAGSIITYWDEPTITLDYEAHPLHDIIHNNWKENKIPNMVLSCATLPSSTELQPIFDDFREKFDGAEIHTITSFDCKKSIPILNKDGYCVLPHYIYSEYEKVIDCVKYCLDNKTLLRYFDLREIVRFVDIVNNQDAIETEFSIDAYFESDIKNITMNSMKEYYLQVLLHMKEEKWPKIRDIMIRTREVKHGGTGGGAALQKTKSMENTMNLSQSGKPITKSASVSAMDSVNNGNSAGSAAAKGILLTTKDAYTLTDGPTIFLAEDASKIGSFYIQQTNIETSVFQTILAKIVNNGKLIKRIEQLENLITAKETKKPDDDGKQEAKRESGRICNESEKHMEDINKLRAEIRTVSLNPVYLPNTRQHQQLWSPSKEIHENAFVSNIGEDMAKEIMMLDIENNLKVLLLLGIGMFTELTPNIRYMEIMKQLADEQRLFIIIASSDYIYGTNYQFCHGFIGKDLKNMTQQKTLQAMGRIGRNNIQQDYTIRFRDDAMIMRLFEKPDVNIEAKNMCELFSCC
jgi:hypothetical protein